MLKAAAVRKYQKFWIKRAAVKNAKNKKEELPLDEEWSTLRRLCEALLSEEDRRVLEEIVMDDLVERTIDDDAAATYVRLAKALQDQNSGFKPNCCLGDGSSPLHVVVKAGFSDCVRLLIQHGADVNAIHLQLGHSVLHTAAMAGSHACMNLLINAGANRAYVNALPGKRRSALHYAAENGSAPCLLLLLHSNTANVVRRNQETQEVRAILDVQDAFGNTALHLACVDGSEDCVRLLIESGASLVVRNAEGKTAVDVARAMAAVAGSDSSRAVLFMVMAAAGLDPLDPSVLSDEPPSPGGRSQTSGSLPVPNLLDGAPAAGPVTASITAASQPTTRTSEPEDLRYSNGEGVLWVVVKDGLLLCSSVGDDRGGSGHVGGGSGPQRRAHAPGKVSKRLRFVRRSILGGSAETAPEPETETEAGEGGSGAGPSLSRMGGNNNLRVEVFRSRREAEERVRAVHYPSALAEAASSSRGSNGDSGPNGPDTGAGPVRQLSGIVSNSSGSSGASGPWGSGRRRRSHSGGGGPGNVAVAAVTETIEATATTESRPAPQFYTAFVDAAQLTVFRTRIPYYYPSDGQRGPSPFSAVRASGLAFNGARRVNTSADASEDPLWAQFQLERARSSSSVKSGAAQDQEDGSGKYQDTSRSNRPLRLMPMPAPSVSPGPVRANVASPTSAAAKSASAAHKEGAAKGHSATTLNKAQAAARRLELSTEVAALQAQVFERLCRLTDLQEALRDRATAAAVPVTVTPPASGLREEPGTASKEGDSLLDPAGPPSVPQHAHDAREDAADVVLVHLEDNEAVGFGEPAGHFHDNDDGGGGAGSDVDRRGEGSSDREGRDEAPSEALQSTVATGDRHDRHDQHDRHEEEGPQREEEEEEEAKRSGEGAVADQDDVHISVGNSDGHCPDEPSEGGCEEDGAGVGGVQGTGGSTRTSGEGDVADSMEEDGTAVAVTALGRLRSSDDRLMDGILLSLQAELQLEEGQEHEPDEERQLSEEGSPGRGLHWVE